MKLVETKTYDVHTDASEYGRIAIVLDELKEVLKFFDTVNFLTFNDYDDEIVLDREDIRSIKILFEALAANEVEGH